MSDFGSKGAVLEKEHFKLFLVVDDDFAEPIWHQVAGGGIGAETDRRHDTLALETTTNAIVNTTGFTPVFLKVVTMKRCFERLVPSSPRSGHFGDG